MSRHSIDKGQRKDSPPLQGRGRGWGLSVEKLDELNHHARAMRARPTEPEARLWRRLSASQLGGFKFRRQAVIAGAIVDFLCPQKALVVEVDGWTHDDPAADARRDARLAASGFRVMRFTNEEVMRNVEGVLIAVLDALQAAVDGWDKPHPNPSSEGEGLETVEAQKLLGISLEGSVR